MGHVIDRIQRFPKTVEQYKDFKVLLQAFAKTAYKYDTMQEYLWAAEQSLGRRLITSEHQFLVENASSPKGNKFTWDSTPGHPSGRYVYERPLNNIYSKYIEKKSLLENKDKRPDSGESTSNPDNILSPKNTGEGKRRRRDLDTGRIITDKDNPRDFGLGDSETSPDKDIYNRDDYGREASKLFSSNLYLLDSNNEYNNQSTTNVGGIKMSKTLNSTKAEVMELLDLIEDNPTIREAMARLVKNGYEPKIAREIIEDATDVGAVSISAKRIKAENLPADKVPERTPDSITKYEGQDLGEDLEAGDMGSLDRKDDHDWEDAGKEIEEGAMEVNYQQHLSKKLEGITAALADLEETVKSFKAEAPTLADIEEEVSALDQELESVDQSLVDVESAVTCEACGSKITSSKSKEAAYGEKVMDIAMGDKETYTQVSKEIEKNDKAVVDAITAARKRRAARMAALADSVEG